MCILLCWIVVLCSCLALSSLPDNLHLSSKRSLVGPHRGPINSADLSFCVLNSEDTVVSSRERVAFIRKVYLEDVKYYPWRPYESFPLRKRPWKTALLIVLHTSVDCHRHSNTHVRHVSRTVIGLIYGFPLASANQKLWFYMLYHSPASHL